MKEIKMLDEIPYNPTATQPGDEAFVVAALPARSYYLLEFCDNAQQFDWVAHSGPKRLIDAVIPASSIVIYHRAFDDLDGLFDRLDQFGIAWGITGQAGDNAELLISDVEARQNRTRSVGFILNADHLHYPSPNSFRDSPDDWEEMERKLFHEAVNSAKTAYVCTFTHHFGNSQTLGGV